MKKFDKPVLWEFRCLLQGKGRHVHEALLDGLLNKADSITEARNPGMLLDAIERNEVTRISLLDGRPLEDTANKTT